MKKSDDKLFNPEFVHFMWDEKLEGREGFFADDICELTNCVYSGDMHHAKVRKSLSPAFPFKDTNNNDWLFFYYDPNYEYKKAWLEGQKVQYMTTIYVKNDWKDVPDEWYWDGGDDTQYRIKQTEWRPFRNVQELRECWFHKNNPTLSYNNPDMLYEPMIWVRSKSNTTSTYLITHYCENMGVLHLCGYLNVGLEQLFADYTFLDGTPCGVEDEEDK